MSPGWLKKLSRNFVVILMTALDNERCIFYKAIIAPRVAVDGFHLESICPLSLSALSLSLFVPPPSDDTDN